MFYTNESRSPPVRLCRTKPDVKIAECSTLVMRDKLSLVGVDEIPRWLVLERLSIHRTMNESRVLVIVEFVTRRTFLSAQSRRRAAYGEVGPNLYRGGELHGCSGPIVSDLKGSSEASRITQLKNSVYDLEASGFLLHLGSMDPMVLRRGRTSLSRFAGAAAVDGIHKKAIQEGQPKQLLCKQCIFTMQTEFGT